MTVVDSFARVVHTVLSIAQTRIELLAIELEEEWVRFLVYLWLSLLALFSLALTVLLAVVLIIVLCWDSCRIPVIVGMMVFFGVVTGIIWCTIRHSFRRKTKLFELTRQEIAKDIDRFTPSAE